MKPLLLAQPQIRHFPVLQCVRKARQNDKGEVDSDSLAESQCVDILKHIADCGYKTRDCKGYSPLSLTYVNGACGWHDDPGFGLVACWLLYSENYGQDAQLITRHGALDMREGDLCVFDANQGHAWISNSICVMFMAAVKRSRSISANKP